jgi:hypothetical protein
LPDNFMREEKELQSLIKVNCINVRLNMKGITFGTLLQRCSLVQCRNNFYS